ncbi:PaaI family thioesterase [Jongsikchunia kroppenstedtii]|uniref:PaaI family thioesterase n=1 Tax=Jongsikchunia kroppenstedtii TaxID=1121721 RepID=UPI0004772521|nr:hotdog domain-containing protein [Jongsikchunia kroppenstedtii]
MSDQSAQMDPTAPPSAEHHEGGFRPMMEMLAEEEAAAGKGLRGGVHYPEFIAQTRLAMDRVKAASPTDEQALAAIEKLKELNDILADAEVDEWSVPSWLRHDLPARGNITLPPYQVTGFSNTDGVRADLTFPRYTLGGNGAAHGGQIALVFDDLLGMTAALSTGQVTRTAYITINYRSVTPILKPLKVATSIDRIEGRKAFVRATMHDGETLCCEADGLFIALRPGQA